MMEWRFLKAEREKEQVGFVVHSLQLDSDTS